MQGSRHFVLVRVPCVTKWKKQDFTVEEVREPFRRRIFWLMLLFWKGDMCSHFCLSAQNAEVLLSRHIHALMINP